MHNKVDMAYSGLYNKQVQEKLLNLYRKGSLSKAGSVYCTLAGR